MDTQGADAPAAEVAEVAGLETQDPDAHSTEVVKTEAVKVAAFDPYAATLSLRWLKKVPVAYVGLVAPIIAITLITAAAIDGMLGNASSIQPYQDFLLAIGKKSLSPHQQFQYPLLRDTAIWIFAAIMVIEFMIMSLQWRLFADGLPKLNKNGVLKTRAAADDQDMLYVPHPLKEAAEASASDRLEAFVEKVNQHNTNRARLCTILYAILALGLSALLMWGERNRVFRVFTPNGLTGSAARHWRLDAYQHWWASLNHPVGAITYFLLVSVALYVILVQTHVGMYAARIAAALPRLARVDANWVNPDGYYGWGPIHQIFGTVWSSMALYGLLVSILAVVLGLGGIGWIPAGIWFVLVTVYFALPWFALRKIEATAKEHHIDVAQAEAEPTTTKEEDELEARVKRYREAHIRPMRLGSLQRVPVVLSVLLPVVLNLVQPFIQTLLSK